MAVYKLTDFSDIVDAVREELKIQSDDTVTLNRIRRIINGVYLQEVIPFARWKWLEGFASVQVPAVYSGGSASVTQNTTAVTLSSAPNVSLGSFLNYKFAVKGENEVYTITAHSAGSTSITVSPAINCSTNTEATFEIYRDWVALPTDCDETVQIWHDNAGYPLEGRGLQDFRRAQVVDPRRSGRPQLYYTGDYYDPTPGTDETESDRYRQLWVYPSISDKNTNLHITYKKQVDPLEDDADEPVLPQEDRIVLVYGALARAWRMQRNPDEALQNERLFKEKLARMSGKVEDSQDMPLFKPDMAYVGTKRGSRFGTRSAVWSAPGSGGGGGATVVTYLADVTIDGANITDDVTVDNGVTIDGRDLSVDGTALDTVVSDLAAHLADTTDAHEASAISVVPAGNLSSTDGQAAFEELQTDIDTGATNLLNHLADTSDAHDASAISVVAAGNLSSTDAQAAFEELQGDIDALNTLADGKIYIGNGSNVATEVTPAGDVTIANDGTTAISSGVIVDGDIKAAAAIARSKIASGTNYRILANDGSGVMSENAAITASKAVVSDANGQLTASATTATELGYVSGVTSGLQVQLDAKQPLDSDLTAVAALSSTGIITRTGTGTASTRTVTGTTNQIGISNGDGVSGNPVVSLASDAVLPGTGSVTVPKGSTAQRSGSPAAGMFRYNTDTNQFEGYGTAWGAIGGASSSINYISNGTAESDTTGWSTYADAAGSSPVDGTGGSSTTTWTRTTSSPLRGIASFILTKDAANRQGEGVGYAFTIDSADKGHVQRISFDYAVASGTVSYGDGTVSTPSDVRVFIYDVTNAALIEPTQTLLNGSGKFMSEFQAASNSTSYRLIFHVATTSTSAWVLEVDNISVGPREIARGPLSTDWAVDTNIARSAGPGVSSQSYLSRRVGDTIFIRGRLVFDGTGSGGIEISLGGGRTIDTAKITSLTANVSPFRGHGILYDLSATTPYKTDPTYSSANTWRFYNSTSTTGSQNGGATGAAQPVTIASGDWLEFDVEFPVTGWATNTATSTDSGTRVVAMSINDSAPTSSAFDGTVNTIFSGTNYFKDTHGAYSTSTGNYTVPESGWYHVSFRVNVGGTEASNDSVEARIYLNGSLQDRNLGRVMATGLSSTSCEVNSLLYATAGQTISPRTFSTISGAVIITVGSGSVFSVYKIQSPQSIGMADFIGARYSTNTATAISTSETDIPFEDKSYDSHNAYNTSTGVYTVPAPGKYEVIVQATLGVTAASNFRVGIKKNGTITKDKLRYGNGSSINIGEEVTDLIDCVAGDQIKGFARSSASDALSGASEKNVFIIRRVN